MTDPCAFWNFALGEPALTRSEVAARLRSMGVAVCNEGTLRYWEQSGGIPKPVRRWHDGATRSVYPESAVEAIFEFCRQTRRVPSKKPGLAGYSLDELRDEMIRRGWMDWE